MIHKAHKIRLYPTKTQALFFRKSCGVARFAYNWALDEWKKRYEKGGSPSAYTLIKELTAIKRKEYKWMLEVGKTCPQYAIHNVEKAYRNFFKKNAKYPKFKKKGIRDSFVAVENRQQFKQKNKRIWIPRLGWVKCAEDLRFDGKVNNVVIKRTANYWFAVINIDLNLTPTVSENQVIVGIDLGLKYLAVTSNGVIYKNNKSLSKRLKKLKHHQRKLSKKEKGSNNRRKQQMRVAKLYYKVSCARKDALHRATTEIIDNAGIIVIEDLNVVGMLKNHHLAQSISDASFGEFRRQLEYKAKWQGKKVIIVDRFFASSKICSNCGWKNVSLKLGDRTFKCNVCGNIIDRDLNAARNLAKYGSTVKTTERKASGDGSSVVEKQHSLSENEELNFSINI